MSPREIFALRDHLGAELKGRTLSDARDVVSLTDVLSQTVLAGRLRERGVIVAPGGPLGEDNHIRAAVRDEAASNRLARAIENVL